MARGNPFALLPIEVELQKEKAFALRGTGTKLERAIEELRTLEASLPSVPPGERALRVQRHARLRVEAERLRWNLMVQREAMGLTRHDDLDRVYPIPAALKP